MKDNFDHPIQKIITESISKIKQSIDVNTIIGEAITTIDGSTIIPITKVSVGFIAGGGEYTASNMTPKNANKEFPFSGGSGAGYNINPIGFIVSNRGGIKYVSVDTKNSYDEILSIVKNVLEKINK